MASPEQHLSLKGYLLLDSGQLRGSFFQRTVVLICQHDAEGAFGLVLNKPSDDIVGDVLLSDVPAQVKNLPLFVGGPVQPTAMSYLHSAYADEEAQVIPGVSIGHSLEALNDLSGQLDKDADIRLFSGYSGWSPGQLEDEMQREAWLTHPATPELIFKVSQTNLWQHVLSLKGWKYKLLSQMPEDPRWN